MASASFGGFGVSFSLSDEFSSVADNIRSHFGQLSADTESMADRVNRGFTKIQQGAVQVGAGLAVLAPIGFGIKFAGEFESMEIALFNLTKNADLAKSSLDQMKQDAAVSPFETADLFKAEQGLMIYGKSVEEARATTMALGEAVAFAGKGSAELGMTGANLADIFSKGKADAIDMKQFLKQGIPIWSLLSESTGKSVAALHEMDISFEMIDQSLKKAAATGGKTEGSMARLALSIQGKFSSISDIVKISLASIGDAVMPAIHPVLDLIIELGQKFIEFSKTALGKTIIMVGIAILSFIALTLIIGGLATIFEGLGVIIAGAFAPLIPFLIIGAAIGAILVHITGSVDNLVTVFKGLGAVFMSAGRDGFNMSQELATALENIGLLDFVVAMGTWFVRIKEFCSGLIDGLMAVYAVVAEVFGVIWEIIVTIVDAAIEVMSWFGVEIGNNTSSLEGWATAGEYVGYVLGVILVIALYSLLAPLYSVATAMIAAFWFPMLIILIIVVVLYILWKVVSFVWDLLKAFGEWVWQYLGPAFEMMGNILKFFWDVLKAIAKQIWESIQPALQMIGDFFSWIWEKLQPLISSLKLVWDLIKLGAQTAYEAVSSFLSSLWDSISAPFIALWNFFTGLWDGIKSAFSDMLSYLGDAWNNSFLGKATSMLVNGAISVASTAGDVASGKETFDSLKAKSNNTDGALNSLGGMNAEKVAGAQPVVNNTNSESVKSVTIINQVDTDELSRRVIEKQEFDAARS